MIRIDILSQDADHAVMRVCGEIWLDYEINLVVQEGKRCLETSKVLVLDLEHLHHFSDHAQTQLKEWQTQGRLEISKHNYRINSSLQRSGLMPKQEGRP